MQEVRGGKGFLSNCPISDSEDEQANVTLSGVISIGPQIHLSHHKEPEVYPLLSGILIQHTELMLAWFEFIPGTLGLLEFAALHQF